MTDDLRGVLDGLIRADARLSQLVSLRDRFVEAQDTDSPRCGRCNHWMNRTCPREIYVFQIGGYHGPSAFGRACEKFSLKQWVADLKAERMAALERDMAAVGIPVHEVTEQPETMEQRR